MHALLAIVAHLEVYFVNLTELQYIFSLLSALFNLVAPVSNLTPLLSIGLLEAGAELYLHLC